ncbi:MAG TPA: hypothetical protein VFV52_10990 [Bacilli bacterium]|nr:hypothetical protein [Bacilli bacterium]
MDPMDWVHSWDDYEIMMYVEQDEQGLWGIYMQGSRVVREQGLFEMELLYDRKIGDLNPEIRREDAPREDDWQERQLRWFLETHPELVEREKQFMREFVEKQE